MDLVRAHVFISGKVQRVSFRWWVLRQAQDLRLRGWVRNRDDGRVEIVAEGEKNKLIELTKLIKKGPLFSKVENVDVTYAKATGELEGFEIII